MLFSKAAHFLVLSSCIAVATPLSAQTASSAHYEGTLTLKDAGVDGRRMELVAPYAFVDGTGLRWEVPVGAQVDGASIPQVFWSIIGGPYEGKYRNASVIHDFFCDVRSRPWQKVDRMFFEAMLASGVAPLKAKVMYLAVVYGGPRWDDQAIHNSTLPPAARAPRVTYSRPLQIAAISGALSFAQAEAHAAPTGEERLKQMANEVTTLDLSLDQIDRLAEADAQNVEIRPAFGTIADSSLTAYTAPSAAILAAPSASGSSPNAAMSASPP